MRCLVSDTGSRTYRPDVPSVTNTVCKAFFTVSRLMPVNVKTADRLSQLAKQNLEERQLWRNKCGQWNQIPHTAAYYVQVSWRHQRFSALQISAAQVNRTTHLRIRYRLREAWQYLFICEKIGIRNATRDIFNTRIFSSVKPPTQHTPTLQGPSTSSHAVWFIYSLVLQASLRHGLSAGFCSTSKFTIANGFRVVGYSAWYLFVRPTHEANTCQMT